MSTPRFLGLPPGVRARQIATARGSFAALEAAATDSASTVVLVPGLTGSKEDFIAILALLARAGFRAVAYDQRGQYETPASSVAHEADRTAAPESFGQPDWSLDGFAADLVACATDLDDRPVHVVGHSFGGLVARAAVLADQARFRSIVLLDSGPAAVPQPHAGTLVQLAGLLDAAGPAPVWELRQAADLEAGVAPPDDPTVRAFMKERFFANDPASLAAIARILATEPDRTDDLAKTGLPALVAFGAKDHDAWNPNIQTELASRLGAPYVSFPEAAHSPAVESPEETVQALVSFWSGVERAG